MYAVILILHVLGATVWTGGHLILAGTVLPRALWRGNPEPVRDFEARYEQIGIPALAIQVITGLWLAFRVLPDPVAWFTFQSSVAVHIALKLFLLVFTVVLAVDARIRIVPRLRTETLPALAWHVFPVTIASVLFVVLGVGIRTGGVF